MQKPFNNNYHRQPMMVFTNDQIKAPNIIIIDEEWKNLWTFPRKRALEMAEEQWKDLVQIRYDQEKMTSMVKLVDYGKYMYQKQKEEKEKKKTQKPNIMKEIKMNYAIWENDLLLKMKKAKEMLWEKFNVKFSIKLKGREKIYKGKAIEKLIRIKNDLADVGKTQYEYPKEEANGFSIILFSK